MAIPTFKVKVLPALPGQQSAAAAQSAAEAAAFAADADASAAASAGSAAGAAAAVSSGVTAATMQANASASSATASANSATASANSATNSAASASAAQSAASTAAAAGRIFDDTTAGLAGTPSGEYFYVPSSSAVGALDLYKDNAGTALYISTTASGDITDRLPGEAPAGFAFSVLDSGGRAAIGVQDDGTFRAQKVATEELAATTLTAPELFTPNGGLATDAISGYALPIVDSLGRMAGGVKDDGELHFKRGSFDDLIGTDIQADRINGTAVADILAGGASAGPPPLPVLMSDIMGQYHYGQSLAVGVSGLPVISITAKYNNVRFVGGVRAGDGAHTSFAPLVEQSDGTNAGETPATGAAECTIQLIQAENFLSPSDYAPFIHAVGVGHSAQTIAQLSKAGGGAPYANFMAAVPDAVTTTNGLNKTYKVGSVSWTHGTSDYLSGTPRNTYQAGVAQLVTDLNTDIKAVTGQPEDVFILCGQSPDHVFGGNNPTIALAQRDLSRTEPRFVIACSMYVFPYADYPHLVPLGYKWLGAYYGLVHKRICVDQADWAPLDCTNAFRQANAVFLTFHVPVGKLVFDTTQVPLRTNRGFTLVNSGGTNIAISSVDITGPNTVRIVAGATLSAGCKVRYGWPIYESVQSGGNLRDQQGDAIVFDPSGINKRLDNWCLIFEETL